MILSAVKFNEKQDKDYLEYCNKCKSNNIEPREQSRYFHKVSVNYGFVYQNSFKEVYWKKRKQDFNF